MIDYLIEQLAEVRAEVAALRAERVTHRAAQVTAVDPAAGTFTGALPDGQELSGLKAPEHFLPAVGDSVLLRLAGATPIYEPARIGAGAVGETELDGAVVEKIDVTLATANGKNSVTYSEDAPDDVLTPGARVGDVWWQVIPGAAAVVVGQWLWNGAGWAPVTLGDEVIAYLTAARIVTGTLAAGVEVAVGDPAGDHTLISGTDGLSHRVEDMVDGIPNEVARFGRTSGGYDPVTGRQTWNVTEQGRAALQGLSVVEDPVIQGLPLSQLLDRNSHDHWHFETPTAGISGITTEVGLFEAPVTVTAGRMYMLIPDMRWDKSDHGAELAVRVRDGGTGTPSLTSPGVYYRQFSNIYNVAYTGQASSPGFWVPSSSGLHRLLMTAGRGGTGTVTVTDGPPPPGLWVLDFGPARSAPGTVNRGGGGASQPAPKTRYVDRIYEATWSRSYRGDGTVKYNGTEVVQGYTPYSASDGNQQAQIGGFADAFGDLIGHLQGATIEKMEVRLWAGHWNDYDGGTAVIGYHNNASPAGMNDNVIRDRIRIGGWPRQADRWVDITTWGVLFRDGAAKGIAVGPGPTTVGEFYGRFAGASAGIATKPLIRITYTK